MYEYDKAGLNVVIIVAFCIRIAIRYNNTTLAYTELDTSEKPAKLVQWNIKILCKIVIPLVGVMYDHHHFSLVW